MTLIFVASLNENMNLANKLQKQLEQLGKNSKIINLVELQLPMYDSLKEENEGIPKKALDLINEMKEAKDYIFVSPEYNYSLPPVLVNMVAWVSRVGDDFRALFANKAVLLASHSGGGGNDVINAMRNQFTKLNSFVMPREIIITYQKALNEKSSLKILSSFVEFSKKL